MIPKFQKTKMIFHTSTCRYSTWAEPLKLLRGGGILFGTSKRWLEALKTLEFSLLFGSPAIAASLRYEYPTRETRRRYNRVGARRALWQIKGFYITE